MHLEQVRQCDGACCVESPRFPNENHSDCIYRDSSKPDKGCMITDGTETLPDANCSVLPNLTAQEAYQQTCLDWPQNSDPVLGETSGCCWQWVNDDD